MLAKTRDREKIIFAVSYLDIIQALITLSTIGFAILTMVSFEQIGIIPILFFSIMQICLNVTQYDIVMHNFIHTPFFKRRNLNRFYEVLCSISAVQSFTASKIQHMAHHKYANDIVDFTSGQTKDPTSTYRHGVCGKHESFLSYSLLSPLRELIEAREYFGRMQVRGRISVEIGAIFLYLGLMALYNWRYFLFFVLIIYVSQILICAQNYCEHFGAMPGNRMADSVSCYGRLYNIIWFNNGYHQEHHYRPGVHWTRLKSLREQMLSEDSRRVVEHAHIFNLPIFKHASLTPENYGQRGRASLKAPHENC